MPNKLRGLYAVTPECADGKQLLAQIEAALSGGCRIVQYRDKQSAMPEQVARARALRELTRRFGARLLVNDDIALAHLIDADGVHLGQSDGSIVEARDRLGRDAQIGVTCHDSRHLAMAAGEAGADYVAFGAFFPTTTKQTEHQAEAAILTWAQMLLEIPCVAIGGITPANCAPLVQAGADFIAVCGAVWNGNEAENIRALHEAIAAA